MLTPFLQSLINNEGGTQYQHYSPKSIISLLHHLDNPHQNIQCIHIAGTNGKGSTAYMVAKILEECGLTVGLYTSPHLIHYNERISINGTQITDDEITHYSQIIQGVCNSYNLQPTFFDVFTAMAFLHFNNAVDLAVIETGLGGRLDSTNVVTPLVSIITKISLDHTAVLGKTLYEIAYQKAGIIKHSIPIVSASQQLETHTVLKAEASNNNAPFFTVGNDITYNITKDTPLTFDFLFSNYLTNEKHYIKNLQCSLTGNFQAENASMAIAAVLLLKNKFRAIVTENIPAALSKVSVPGRCEVIVQNPLILFDCAHNPDALRTTLLTIKNKYPEYEMTFCVSFMKDKDVISMLSILKGYTSKPILYFTLDDTRCFVPDSNIANSFSLETISDVEVLNKKITALKNQKNIMICTGTFRLYSYIRNAVASLV